MKKLFIFLLLLILVVLVVWLGRKTETMVTTPDEINVTLADGTYCYQRNQVATSDAPYAVEEDIKLVINGNTVTGTKSGTQSGPDMTNGYEGSLTGTRDGENLDLVFAYTIEGSQNKEQELYTWSTTKLQKSRYVLKENANMLVPDLTSTQTILTYESVKCVD